MDQELSFSAWVRAISQTALGAERSTFSAARNCEARLSGAQDLPVLSAENRIQESAARTGRSQDEQIRGSEHRVGTMGFRSERRQITFKSMVLADMTTLHRLASDTGEKDSPNLLAESGKKGF
jgi:hypothetical protein